jgi:hypothetical protein
VHAGTASLAVGSIVVPFNFDCEGGYVIVDKIGRVTAAVSSTVTIYLKEGTTKIGSATVTSANANATSIAATFTSVTAPVAKAITLATGYNQFAAGSVIRVACSSGANTTIRGVQVVLVGMKVDNSYGYRA